LLRNSFRTPFRRVRPARVRCKRAPHQRAMPKLSGAPPLLVPAPLDPLPLIEAPELEAGLELWSWSLVDAVELESLEGSLLGCLRFFFALRACSEWRGCRSEGIREASAGAERNGTSRPWATEERSAANRPPRWAATPAPATDAPTTATTAALVARPPLAV